MIGPSSPAASILLELLHRPPPRLPLAGGLRDRCWNLEWSLRSCCAPTAKGYCEGGGEGGGGALTGTRRGTLWPITATAFPAHSGTRGHRLFPRGRAKLPLLHRRGPGDGSVIARLRRGRAFGASSSTRRIACGDAVDPSEPAFRHTAALRVVGISWSGAGDGRCTGSSLHPARPQGDASVPSAYPGTVPDLLQKVGEVVARRPR